MYLHLATARGGGVRSSTFRPLLATAHSRPLITTFLSKLSLVQRVKNVPAWHSQLATHAHNHDVTALVKHSSYKRYDNGDKMTRRQILPILRIEEVCARSKD